MTLTQGLAALAVCLPLAACMGDDDIPFAIDGPIDAGIDATETDAASAIDDIEPLRLVRRLTEYERDLDSILVDGAFPEAAAGFAPNGTCCGPGGVTLCPANPALWIGPWEAIHFSVDEAQAYVFNIGSQGSSFILTAAADLDCDGNSHSISLACRIVGGVRECWMSFPAPGQLR